MRRNKRVLIVEDDEQFRRLIAVALGLAGYAVRQASDGVAALTEIDLQAPDIVVLDLGLPGIDGFGVHAQIRATAALRHIPVVIVTGAVDVAGVDAACVMRKPVHPDAVVAAVEKCLASGSTAALDV